MDNIIDGVLYILFFATAYLYLPFLFFVGIWQLIGFIFRLIRFKDYSEKIQFNIKRYGLYLCGYILSLLILIFISVNTNSDYSGYVIFFGYILILPSFLAYNYSSIIKETT